MAQVKILAFAGSTRKDSFNKKLVKVAMRGAEATGAQVTYLDLRDLELPLYDGDLEDASGIPAGGKRFKQMLDAHDALLISSPEYNSSISGALKNAIDWASRPQPGEKPLQQFVGKVATIMSASPGALGGLRGLVTLRSILGNIQVIVLPNQVSISNADQAFDESGNLKDERKRHQVEGLGKGLAEFVAQIKK